MSRAAERKVRLAVALLPKSSRNRYREQWQGELRDADALDIPQAEIARGALGIAARIDRPLPSWLRTTPPRLSFALALSAAVLSLSDLASLVPMTDGLGVIQDPSSLASTPLITWVLVIPVFALVMVLASRVASVRERVSVGLLAVATYLPLFRARIDGIDNGTDVDWISPGGSTYAIAAVLVIAAVLLARREYGLLRLAEPSVAWRRRLLRSGVAGLAVALVVAICSMDEFALWASRPRIEWFGSKTGTQRVAFEQWLALEAEAQAEITSVLVGWAIAGILVALAAAAFGISRRATLRHTVLLAAGALCATLLSYGGVVMFLGISSDSVHAAVSVGLVMLVARIGLLVVVLLGVGRGTESGSDERDRAIPKRSTFVAG